MTLAYCHIIFMLSNTASFFLAVQIDIRRTCFIDRSKWREVVGSFSETAMAAHSSTLAWKIPRMEEPGRLQSMGSQRVWHDWATSLSLFTFMHWRKKRQPTPVFLPGESQGRGAWWAAVYGVTQSRTRLKRLSSSRAINIRTQQCVCGWGRGIVT